MSQKKNNGRDRRATIDDRSVSPMPSEWEIDEKLLTYSEKIAQGAFSVLYLGQYCGQEVAVKVLKTPKNESHDDLKREFQQELSTLRKVHHKNVIQLIGRYNERTNVVSRNGVYARRFDVEFLAQKCAFEVVANRQVLHRRHLRSRLSPQDQHRSQRRENGKSVDG